MARPKPIPGDEVFGQRLKTARRIFLAFFFLVLFCLARVQIFSPPSIFGQNKPGRSLVETAVSRGRILDRSGRILAMSVPVHDLYLDSWQIRRGLKTDPDIKANLEKSLAGILNLATGYVAEKLEQPYPLVKKDLTLEEYQALKSSSLPGLVFQRTYRRVYPNKKLACHVLGFAGRDNCGLEGVELFYENYLKGKPGLAIIPKDGDNNPIPSLEKTLREPAAGTDIFLTLDFNIQTIVEEELENLWGQFRPVSVTAVVMDPENGEILALANMPGFDPNEPDSVPVAYRRNRAVTDLFEPGSVFKIVTATACLDRKQVSVSEKIFCENGKWYVRDHWLHDAHPYGFLTGEEVIIKSSNIGTVKMALRLGEEVLYSYCRAFGFGQVTGVDLPGEIPGILRPVERWSGYSITAVPIGQEVGINAIQGTRAMAVFSNGGRLVKPHILKAIGVPGETNRSDFRVSAGPRVVSEEVCRVMNDILEKVVSPEGTASRAYVPGYHVYGKTGTAQKIEGNRYSASKYVASFVGYLHSETKKVVISINVDEPKSFYFGGQVAAPAFRNILWRIIQYWNIPPDENLEQPKLVMRK